MKRLIGTLLIITLGMGLAQYSPEPTQEQLLEIRELIAAYEDVEAAQAAGYEQFGGCMSSAQGSQGIHFSNSALIEDPALDPMQPELIMYEPREDGSLRLIGVEYIVFQGAWHEAGNEAAPALLGQEFVLNTTLLDEPFYALHLWIWQYNPKGLFANWNPLVVCPEGSAHR
jgi:hypothetical protein